MVTNLLATTDLTATTSTRADCPGTGTAATVVLKRYNTDAGSDYTFSGCLKGRRS
jgi:hypothetical protein